MNKGMIASIEGGEGTGKSTIIEYLKKYFKEKNIEFIVTREPGGVKISEQIRNVILDKENTEMDGKTETLLFAAARRQHLVEKVIPALKENKIVICDRYVDSSLVYQGYVRGIGIEEVMVVNKFAIGEYMPDLTILLDLDPKIGLERIAANKNREINRLDLEKIEFHKKVREGYLHIQEMYPGRIKIVDASKPIDDVFNDIKDIVERKLNTKEEIERKFLVNNDVILPKLCNLNPCFITQKYLSLNPEKRIRLESYKSCPSKFFYAEKSDGTIKRDEYEKEISFEEYSKFDKEHISYVIKKRYILKLYDGLIAQIDVYDKCKIDGLVTVEVEFTPDKNPDNFIIPDWFGKEITYDKTYKNKNLAISR